MRDGFANYDNWKLMSPDDEQDDREEKALRDERLRDRADEMRDRDKDERNLIARRKTAHKSGE